MAASALTLAACGSSSDGSSNGSGSPGYGGGTKPDAAANASVTLKSHHGKLGTFLVGDKGLPAYLFEKDTSTTSTCNAACASAWPPVLTKGTPKAAGGLKQSLVGTTKRTDGGTQVTYGGHPLYGYAGDQQSGVPTGQGLKQFGAPWYVVEPSGQKLDED